jgi:hypothetical protein
VGFFGWVFYWQPCLVVGMVEYVGQVAQSPVPPVVQRADAGPGAPLRVQFYCWHAQANKPGKQKKLAINIFPEKVTDAELGHCPFWALKRALF